MNRLVSSGLVLAGFVSLPVAISHLQAQHPPVADYRSDPRFDLLHKFFAKANCPAKALASVFLEAADDYALDWRLLPSISWVESGGGKVAKNNNLFGWKSGEARFQSLAAGIHDVGFHLAHSRLYRGKNTHQILTTYNSNPEYAVKVKYVMRQIAPTE